MLYIYTSVSTANSAYTLYSISCPVPPHSPPPLVAHPLYPTSRPPQDAASPPLLPPAFTTIERGRKEGVGGGEWVTGEDQSEDEELIDRGLPSRPEYPAPLAVS